jgi:hypothetical protein
MLRGRGGKFSKIGLIAGLIFAVVFATGLITWGNLKSADYERHANSNKRHYSEYARKKIVETCVAISPLEKARCVYEARDQEREHQYNQSDLVAQRQSALWAYIMGLAAVIGMALSALGVWLVKTTFDETRCSNEIARMAQRPWLDVQIKLHGIARAEKGYALRIEMNVENLGQTPANHLRYAVDGFFLEDLDMGSPFEFGKLAGERNDAIKSAAKRVRSANAAADPEGLTIFPQAIEPVFLEEVIAAGADKQAHAVAWLVVGLKYSLGHKDGNTVRVFIVKSFGLPNETGFDSIGDWGLCYTDTDARIDVWERGGYAD